MEDIKNQNTDQPSFNSLHQNKSLYIPRKLNHEGNDDSQINIDIKNKNILNKSHNPRTNFNKKEKHLFIIHKINIKDKKNMFYKTGVKDIFNDENLFLSDKYKDKQVIIGRNKSNMFKSRHLMNYQDRLKYKNFNKSRIQKSKEKNLGRIKNDNLRNKRLIDKNLVNNAYESKESINNNNTSIYGSSIYNKHDSLMKSLNIFGKRSSIFYSGNNYITDGELKLLYQQYLDLEKENKRKEILEIKLNVEDEDKTSDKNINTNENTINNKININKTYHKFYKNTIDKEINTRLDLQQKILNKFQKDHKYNQKLLKKIIKYTSKDNNDLLMNQLDNYRIKIEKIGEDIRSNKIYNNNNYKNIHWLSSLRNYPKEKNNNNNEDNIIYDKNNSTLPLLYKKINNNNKDDIYDNYINNLQYSFGSSSNLYCDIESNISPLYAFILSDNLKNKEKITNTHIDNYYNYNSPETEYYKKLKKNLSVPSLRNGKCNNSKNINNDLNIEGKRLIDYEFELAKKLEGKRKRLIKTIYNEEEIEPKTFAKSKMMNSFYFSKGIKNTFNLHNN